jgi:hypothetical protein
LQQQRQRQQVQQNSHNRPVCRSGGARGRWR